jgi:hypothetical protein
MNKMDKRQFPPGFFDKPSEEIGLTDWLHKHWKSVSLFSIVALCFVGGGIAFLPLRCSKDQKTNILNNISDSLSTDTILPVVVDTVPTTNLQTEGNELPDISELNEQTQTTIEEIVTVEESIEETVLSVIRGNYGNNPVRRRKLGDRYQDIQDRVNQMYREGKVR